MSRRRSNPRRRKRGFWSGLKRAAAWYGGFCVLNMAADWYLGNQGGPDVGGIIGTLAAVNGDLMALNVLNYIGGNAGTAGLPVYQARIVGHNFDGTPIWG